MIQAHSQHSTYEILRDDQRTARDSKRKETGDRHEEERNSLTEITGGSKKLRGAEKGLSM